MMSSLASVDIFGQRRTLARAPLERLSRHALVEVRTSS